MEYSFHRGLVLERARDLYIFMQFILIVREVMFTFDKTSFESRSAPPVRFENVFNMPEGEPLPA
jgi:hypothetical protein